jgi:hypothetical protein
VRRPGASTLLRVGIICQLSLTFGPSIASPAEIEHWTCFDGPNKIVWTIAENRMFVAKGKGALSVASNSPTTTVAFDLHRMSDGKAISTVYVLDKAGHQLITYDESNAVIFDGKLGIPFEPRVTVNPCAAAADKAIEQELSERAATREKVEADQQKAASAQLGATCNAFRRNPTAVKAFNECKGKAVKDVSSDCLMARLDEMSCR